MHIITQQRYLDSLNPGEQEERSSVGIFSPPTRTETQLVSGAYVQTAVRPISPPIHES